MAAGTIVATSASPAGAYALGTVTASPSSNLVDNQTITVHISGFGTDTGPETTLYVVECTPKIVSSGGDTSYCDQSDPTSPTQSPTVPEHVVKITDASNGTATATFPVHTGSDWLGTHPGAKCDFNNSCYVVVTDGQTEPTTNYAGFAPLTFKDTRAATKTKVTGAKKAKAGGKLKLTAKTTGGSALSGSVVFKDGSKKIKKVKETASGVVKAVEKKLKPGKHKITATYSGNSKNKGSKGTLKVKVKKKK